jgi:RNA polymerase sigma-70 factor (ECF subfamily)
MNDYLTDNQLIEQTQQGQQDAYGFLVGRHQAKMRSFVAQYVTNRDDVFDIVQDAFIDIYRSINSLPPEVNFVAWLRTICRRKIVNHHRKAKIHRNAVALMVDDALVQKATQSSQDTETNAEKITALKQCISKLGQTYQNLIFLRYNAKTAVQDIAEQFHQSASSISMRLYRIRTQLARCVEKRLVREGGNE